MCHVFIDSAIWFLVCKFHISITGATDKFLTDQDTEVYNVCTILKLIGGTNLVIVKVDMLERHFCERFIRFLMYQKGGGGGGQFYI